MPTLSIANTYIYNRSPKGEPDGQFRALNGIREFGVNVSAATRSLFPETASDTHDVAGQGFTGIRMISYSPVLPGRFVKDWRKRPSACRQSPGNVHPTRVSPTFGLSRVSHGALNGPGSPLGPIRALFGTRNGVRCALNKSMTTLLIVLLVLFLLGGGGWGYRRWRN